MVYNRKKKVNAMGTALVQIEAYLEGKKAYFSTGVYLLPSQWDCQRSLVIGHPHAELLNRFLQECLLKLEWKELQAWKQGKTVNLDLLKEAPAASPSTPASSVSIVEQGRKWVEASDRKESTRQNLNTTLDLLESFRPQSTFQDLSYEWLTDFEQYLRNRLQSVNTIAKHLKHLRILVNEAIRHGYIPFTDSPFRNYRIKMGETHYAFLLPEEVERLEKLELTGKNVRLQHILDAFLFCCYTGLRYSDFVQQKLGNIIDSGGHRWLVFKSVKTSVESRVPIDLIFQGKALAILNKYKQLADGFFCLPANSTVNKLLLRLGQLAGIEKHFSFHSARHTNATLLIYMGAQITTVQKLLGHRNVKTTQGYSDILAETIVKDLQRCTL